MIRQAVSYWKAIETNQWATTHQSNNDSPRFDFEQIDQLRKQIDYEQNQWQLFFERHTIEPLKLTYEEIVNRIPADSCLFPELIADIFWRYTALSLRWHFKPQLF